MAEIFVGSLALSIVHVLMPNHWMPIAVIGKGEGWEASKVRQVAALAGLSHSLSTIFIGVGVGLLGMKLAAISVDVMRLAAPSIFFIFGIVYLMGGIRDGRRSNSGGHRHPVRSSRASTYGATTAIFTTMFLTPCIEIETYFFRASIMGWSGITLVGITYIVVTVVGILSFVEIVRRGLDFRGFQLLERYEKQIVGMILMVLAVVTYFIFHEV